MEELLQAIDAEIERRGLSRSQVSKLATGNVSTLKNLHATKSGNRERRSTIDNLQSIATYLGLEFYLGPTRSLGFAEAVEAFRHKSTDKGWVFLHPLQAEQLGKDSPPIDRMFYPESWFEDRGMTPETTALIHVTDAAMQPLIPDGATAVIDTADTEIGDAPTLQATKYANLIRIRRIERADDLIISRADHPLFPTDTFNKDSAKLFTRLGRVRAVVREFD